MRDPSSKFTRCFVCATSAKRGPGALSYFSFARGTYHRVPVCGRCMDLVLTWMDARRKGAA